MICGGAVTATGVLLSHLIRAEGRALHASIGIALGGVGEDAKIGASGLIMAILGGALLTPLQGKISDLFGVNASYLVPLVCFCVVLAYTWYVVHNSVEKIS